jgi:hypothetical protein
MPKLHYPSRIFSLSDCHGGHAVWNPLKSPDVAARLAEAIRSDFPGLQHFDIYGVPEMYYNHIAREALRLHRDNPEAESTGLFINNAPRTKANANGEPFYLAEFKEKIRIVVTPLSALSAVKDSVKKLWFLPNQGNGLYNGDKEQHRSSYVPRLLATNHGLKLQEADPDSIPDPPKGCSLAYVDRFGNLALFENSTLKTKSIHQKITQSAGEKIKFRIGKHAENIQIGQSLSKAEPGDLVIYSNDNSVEILRKWKSNWNFKERILNSAYSKFGKPQIGDLCGM